MVFVDESYFAIILFVQKIILYYKFTPVKDPEAVKLWQIALCARLGLNGRIIVSKHGINGTLGGDKEAVENYIEAMERNHTPDQQWEGLRVDLNEDELAKSDHTADFSDIEYKWSDGGYNDFPKLNVKHRKELVTLAPDEDFDPFDQGTALRPEEWHDFMAKNPDVPILDARNDYESEIGVFKNAIAPKIKTFKEIKPELEKLDKDKPIMTYCTGDIRCEYLSAYMKHKGFKEVYHLDGGIVKYGEKFADQGFWDGKCFVFDKRMKVAFSDESKDIGSCSQCGQQTSEHINCANTACNFLVLKCEDCAEQNLYCGDCMAVANAA